jgi:hypothetical protein
VKEVACLEIAVLDDIVPFTILSAVGGRDRFDRVLAVLDRRHRDGEQMPRLLARPRERERDCGRLGFPSRRQLQRELPFASGWNVARELHLEAHAAGG